MKMKLPFKEEDLAVESLVVDIAQHSNTKTQSSPGIDRYGRTLWSPGLQLSPKPREYAYFRRLLHTSTIGTLQSSLGAVKLPSV